MIGARALVLMGLTGLALGACEAQPTPRVNRARVDKQAMFGSASLVPTREGERARRELAVAGELELALEQLGLGPAHVDVELREPAAVIVVARLPGDRTEAFVRAEIAELSQALVPELEPTQLHAWLRPAIGDEDQDQGPPSAGSQLWAVMLLSLGLGLSLGIVGERLHSRRG